ncbi:hypothetical protein [Streptomyces sp. NPDC017991]|uniref:hypothetical protein n=1 Tax=Streptomyces sp. NPDC017991 TaxID=3365026 RepID=UPI0037A84394
MDDATRDRTDLHQLLRLIGMLGNPNEAGFWDSWRTNLDGYSFKKMKTGIALAARPDTAPRTVHTFAGYVLKFFSRSTPEEEEELIRHVGVYLSGHREVELSVQFLADIRATAWRVYRDYGGYDPQVVATRWAEAEL